MRDCIHIWLWGQEIGSLMWRYERHSSYFVYHPDFIASDIEPFPLVAPKAFNKAYVSEDKRMYQHLPAFLADSLPDDWGNALFQQWQLEQGLPDSKILPLDKLTFIGSRGMGALEFVPDAQVKPRAEKIDIASLAKLSKKIFEDREKAVIEPGETITKKLLMTVGTSVGGRQPKALIAINRETGEIRSGQIAGLDGFDYYILKFGDKERSTAELEMTYTEMAREAGIDMMPCFIKEADGEKHFMTQRFDRINGEKVHLQTLAAMNPDAYSYEQLMLVCRNLHLPDATGEEIFRRMVFNYLANNTDDHNKNFNVGGYQPHSEHCLLLRGKVADWTKEEVLLFAEQNDIKNPEKIIRQVAAAVMNFRALAEKNGVRQEWVGRIEECLKGHLREWNLVDSGKSIVESFRLEDGREVRDVHLEQAYKGNIHLHATIDGVARRWVLRPSMPEYARIVERGIANVPDEWLREWVEERIRL